MKFYDGPAPKPDRPGSARESFRAKVFLHIIDLLCSDLKKRMDTSNLIIKYGFLTNLLQLKDEEF